MKLAENRSFLSVETWRAAHRLSMEVMEDERWCGLSDASDDEELGEGRHAAPGRLRHHVPRLQLSLPLRHLLGVLREGRHSFDIQSYLAHFDLMRRVSVFGRARCSST